MDILIIEDETPAFIKLKNCLERHLGESFSYTHIRSVEEGVDALNKSDSFELIFSDIKLLDGSAFEIFEVVTFSLPIVFCTAYDEYLLEAFKTNGIDYILKPYSQEDISHAIQKYRSLFLSKSLDQALLNELKSLVSNKEKKYKKRFAVKKHSGILLVETKEISYIEAFGELSRLIDINGKIHFASTNIGRLMIDLDPDRFFKINRSQIVNIDQIEKIDSHTKNRLSIFMKGHKSVICTSSSTTKAFRNWIKR